MSEPPFKLAPEPVLRKISETDSAPCAPKLDELLCFAIHSTGFAFNRAYREPLRRLGLTYPQYLAMLALWSEDGVAVGRLGDKLFLDTSTLTPLLKRLEAMGLIERRRCEADERRVLVTLTDKGWALRGQAAAVTRCIFAAADTPLDEIVQLTQALQSLRARLEAAAPGDICAAGEAEGRP